MREGSELVGVDIYTALKNDDDFCAQLGKVVLASGRLEAMLAQYVDNKSVNEKIKKATLGKLTRIAHKNRLLSGLIPHLLITADQRNYLSHNLYALFAGLVEETVLSRSGFTDSDIDVYTDIAQQLVENIDGLADIIYRYE